ncbi:hypothetical protein TeGR_g8694 [Tetraparma gracilis]|nr:hypothetical protein TeGR_g8694 [Tetraparma gracilis]
MVSSNLIPRPSTSSQSRSQMSRSQFGGFGGSTVNDNNSVSSLASSTFLRGSAIPNYVPVLSPASDPAPIVLLFHGYFWEDVIESQTETRRLHKCEIYWYMEDMSIEILEIKQENSGIPQGALLSRRKVKVGGTVDRPEYLSPRAFKVGETVDVFSRGYTIISCNVSTQKWCEETYGWSSQDLAPRQWPTDEFTVKNYSKMIRETGAGVGINRNRKMHEMKEYMEAYLGKPTSMSDLGSFLAHDNKTLAFDVLWDDTERLYGEVRFFKMYYFLADDTMEILPVHTKNDGRDQFPKLLKRSKVPKDSTQPFGDKYTWRDLRIGASLNIFSRRMVIFRSDAFTKKYYQSKNIDIGPDFEYVDNDVVKNERQIPPYNGFGSEEDSLMSCTGGIKPKAPKKDFHWDKRGYGPGDFYVGAVMNINCHKFVLLDADEYTYRLMENDIRTFPLSDYEKIHPMLREHAELIRQFFLKEARSDFIDFVTMEKCLNEYCGLKLRKQQLICVWRKLDKKGKGKVSFSKLVRLAENLPIGVTIAGLS